MFYGYLPEWKDGMRLIVPITRDDKVSNRCSHDTIGTFYVTDDGYGISTFTEDGLKGKSYSGIQAEELMKELKK